MRTSAQRSGTPNTTRSRPEQQNVGWRGENRNLSSATWSQRIKNWFDEHKDYPPEGIASFKIIRGPAKTGHFTQLVWGETRYVGCGYTFYTLHDDNNPKKYQTTQVCNYGPSLADAVIGESLADAVIDVADVGVSHVVTVAKSVVTVALENA
ncbi:hypothetical protein MTO96_018030 [Rhipicephalus appendiculatus]